MLFHFSKRQRRIDTFAQLQRNPGGYVKICLLATRAENFPRRSFKEDDIFVATWSAIWNRSRPGSDRYRSDLKLVSFVHGFHERVLGRLVETRGESRILQGMPFGDPRSISPPRRNRRCWTLTVAQQRQPPPPRLFVTIVPYVRWNQSIPAVSADRIPISRHSAATRTFYTSFKRAPLVGLVRNV